MSPDAVIGGVFDPPHLRMLPFSGHGDLIPLPIDIEQQIRMGTGHDAVVEGKEWIAVEPQGTTTAIDTEAPAAADLAKTQAGAATIAGHDIQLGFPASPATILAPLQIFSRIEMIVKGELTAVPPQSGHPGSGRIPGIIDDPLPGQRLHLVAGVIGDSAQAHLHFLAVGDLAPQEGPVAEHIPGKDAGLGIPGAGRGTQRTLPAIHRQYGARRIDPGKTLGKTNRYALGGDLFVRTRHQLLHGRRRVIDETGKVSGRSPAAGTIASPNMKYRLALGQTAKFGASFLAVHHGVRDRIRGIVPLIAIPPDPAGIESLPSQHQGFGNRPRHGNKPEVVQLDPGTRRIARIYPVAQTELGHFRQRSKPPAAASEAQGRQIEIHPVPGGIAPNIGKAPQISPDGIVSVRESQGIRLPRDPKHEVTPARVIHPIVESQAGVVPQGKGGEAEIHVKGAAANRILQAQRPAVAMRAQPQPRFLRRRQKGDPAQPGIEIHISRQGTRQLDSRPNPIPGIIHTDLPGKSQVHGQGQNLSVRSHRGRSPKRIRRRKCQGDLAAVGQGRSGVAHRHIQASMFGIIPGRQPVQGDLAPADPQRAVNPVGMSILSRKKQGNPVSPPRGVGSRIDAFDPERFPDPKPP